MEFCFMGTQNNFLFSIWNLKATHELTELVNVKIYHSSIQCPGVGSSYPFLLVAEENGCFIWEPWRRQQCVKTPDSDKPAAMIKTDGKKDRLNMHIWKLGFLQDLQKETPPINTGL